VSDHHDPTPDPAAHDERVTVWWAGDGPTAIAVAGRAAPNDLGDTEPVVEIGIPAVAVGPDGLVRISPPIARVLATHLAHAADVAEREANR